VSTLREFFAHIRREYKMTEIEYRALFKAQGGRCYVCRKARGRTKRLGVDHDHLTGEIRGLVCTGSLNAQTCNRLIAIYDRAALLRAAAMLSDPPPARAVLSVVRQADRVDSVSVPSLVGGESFLLSEIKGVNIDG
jgi:hypothetical protein